MTSLYGRVFELNIGRKEELIESTKPSIVVRPNGVESVPAPLRLTVEGTNVVDESLQKLSYQDFLVRPTESIKITNLNIKAKVTDSKTGKTNKDNTTIEIMNLTKAKQQFIQVDDTVLLKAGYKNEGELPLIFAGQVVSVETIKVAQDDITRIRCKSAGVVRRNVKISKKPRRNETRQDIAEYLAGIAAKNGIPTGNLDVIIPDSTFKSGYGLVGNFFTVMEEWCDNFSMRSYISLGKLYIEPKDSVEFKDVVNVKEDNVKGSIRPLSSSVGKTAKKKGIKFTTFLDGRITTSKKVRVRYGEYTGDYKIIQVVYDLDYEGKKWDSVVTCERIN